MVEPMKRVILAVTLVLGVACGQDAVEVASTGIVTTTTHPPSTTTTEATTTTVAALEIAGATPTPSTSSAPAGSTTTSTTSPPPTTEAPPPPPEAAQGNVRTVSSTNYCLTGTMANGERVHDGAVAVNSADWSKYRGTSWTVLDGEFAGRTFVVKDHGPGADFDIWVSSCPAARRYGRQSIRVQG